MRPSKKPLLFIQRTQFKKIESIKDLDGTIGRLLDRAEAACSETHIHERLNAVRDLFCDFSSSDDEGKKRSVVNALGLLENLDRKGESGGNDMIEPRERDEVQQHDRQGAFEERVQALSTPIQFVKGVGPRMATLLKKKGIETVEDALFFIPRDYEDRRSITSISSAPIGCHQTLRGTIRRMNLVRYQRRRVFEMVIGDDSGTITAKWFNANPAHLKRRFKQGQQVLFSGKISAFRQQKEILHPDIEIIDDDTDERLHFSRIVPLYSETEGLHQKTLRRIMKNVVDNFARTMPDGLPRSLCRKRHLVDNAVAFERIHFPAPDDDLATLVTGRSNYHRRIVFDELFFFELGLALRKRGIVLERGIGFCPDGVLFDKMVGMIPFELTRAQKRVIKKIRADMAQPYPMNRLVQGDVGSGKTLVAFAAALTAIENNYQVALMAPTELLAEQHNLNLQPLARDLGITSAYLSSSIKGAAREAVYEDIKNGSISLIIGTHAVIQESVQFHKLGLGIIDEQHRFGVIQRATLKDKGENPDVLVMTATPIPRTLALTVYGDLDVSVIDELPAGRMPVKTKVIYEKDRKKVYDLVRKEINKGLQAYIVYPLVEESEKLDLMAATQMFEHLQKDIFPDCRLGLLHGKMKGEDKESVMEQFKSGGIQILVATTVIEVGIDVPQATVMVVEHAERFGLSQLHQLRGRVGRGKHQSLCILLAQYGTSEEARRRLQVMEQTTDGFKIAEEDLQLRGPGEFLGVRQSGLPDFRVANILRDARVLNEAREDAFDLVRRDPRLAEAEHHFLKEILRHRWEGRFGLASVG